MSQPPVPLTAAQQQDLVQRIGRACASATPPGWRRLRVEYRAAGRHVEADVFTTAPDGRDYPARPHPEAVRLLGVLRTGMYRRGRGTWLSATLLFTPQAPPHLDFRPDVEPLWRRPPPPLGFQDELRFFPRSEAFIPPWLHTRAGLPPLPAPWTPDLPPPAAAPQPGPADAPGSAAAVAHAEPATPVDGATPPRGNTAPPQSSTPPVSPAPDPAAPRQEAGPAIPASGETTTAADGGAAPEAAVRDTVLADETDAAGEAASFEGAAIAPVERDTTASVAAVGTSGAASPQNAAASVQSGADPAPQDPTTEAVPAAESGAMPPAVADPPAATAAEMRTPRVYDGLDESGQPVVEREPLPEGERERVLAYLESAPVVLASRSFDVDAFDPERTDVVPLTFRTDGSWVWPGAVAYYLREHALAPDPDLVRHIRGRRFAVPEVGEPARELALAAVTGAQPVH